MESVSVKDDKLQELRAERLNESKMGRTFRDMLSFVIYTFLLVALAYDSREQITFLQNQNIKNDYLKPSVRQHMIDAFGVLLRHNESLLRFRHDFVEQVSFADFGSVFKWLHKDIIHRTYPTTWIDNKALSGDLATAISSCDCQRQGPFRLRQLRVRKSEWNIKSSLGRPRTSITVLLNAVRLL